MSETPFGTPAPPPPKPSSLARYLLAFGMVSLIAGYVLAAVLTRGVWAAPAPQESIRATFTALSSDGTPPSTDVLSQTKKILEQRVNDLGGPPSEVVTEGDVFTVTVPAPNEDVRNIGARGMLYVRPVIHDRVASYLRTVA